MLCNNEQECKLIFDKQHSEYKKQFAKSSQWIIQLVCKLQKLYIYM